MNTMHTRNETIRSAQAAVRGVVVCAGFIGMKPATQHAIKNQRDPGCSAL